MKTTHPSVLIVAFVGGGLVVGAIVGTAYSSLPPMPRGAVITAVLVALVEGALALSVRRRLQALREARKDPKPRAENTRITPIEPMLVARYAALARASSLAGALVTGAWVAVLVVLANHRSVDAVDADRRVSIAGVISGVVLVAAALFLEWVCRAPPPQQEQKQPHAHAA